MSALLERQALHHAIDELSDEALIELAQFVEFLQFRQRQGKQAGAHSPIEYTQSTSSSLIREKLAQDYDALAAMYDELADELTDEVWLPLENEALARTERAAS